jgi:hypothetical protein
MLHGAKSLILMARPKGFEPLTPRFVVWCSAGVPIRDFLADGVHLSSVEVNSPRGDRELNPALLKTVPLRGQPGEHNQLETVHS